MFFETAFYEALRVLTTKAQFLSYLIKGKDVRE
jgi:hypothetical protein